MINIKIPNWPDISLPKYYPNSNPSAEWETKDWMVKNVKEDWLIIDCGANIGYHTILLAQLATTGAVFAFEPTSTMDMLRDNIVHSDVYNVWLHQKAVGQFTGRFTETIFRIWGAPPEVMEYDFITIDDFVKKEELERLDLIKIDVDSFDFEALMGAAEVLEKFKPVIIVELNDALKIRGYNVNQVLEWMNAQDYVVTAILDGENYVMRPK